MTPVDTASSALHARAPEVVTPLRVGMIGCGNISDAYVRNSRQGQPMRAGWRGPWGGCHTRDMLN